MLSVLDYKVIARPNNSLSSDDALKLMAVLVVIAMIVAIGFVHVGAWLVLPFAGLELIAFGCAFYWVRLHASDFESITVAGDKVVIEKCNRNHISAMEFQRYWTQVYLKRLTDGKTALCIGSHGKEVEFGKHFISDEQRVALAPTLKQILKNIN